MRFVTLFSVIIGWSVLNDIFKIPLSLTDKSVTTLASASMILLVLDIWEIFKK